MNQSRASSLRNYVVASSERGAAEDLSVATKPRQLVEGEVEGIPAYLRLLVSSSAALRACASFTGSSFAQKCM